MNKMEVSSRAECRARTRAPRAVTKGSPRAPLGAGFRFLSRSWRCRVALTVQFTNLT